MFEHFQVGKFFLKIKALNNLGLPGYKGSTLRGGFGQALKEVVCALRRQDCATCLLRGRCVYVYVFETPPPANAEMMRLYPSAPHPFVIEPPLDDQMPRSPLSPGKETSSPLTGEDGGGGDRSRHRSEVTLQCSPGQSIRRKPPSRGTVIREGEVMEFGLVLVGRGLDYLPYFIYAFMRLGERGLGRGRGKFALEQVLAANGEGPLPIYGKDDQTLRQAPPYPTWEAVRARSQELAASKTLTLNFLTPTRVKFQGGLLDEPEFHHLIRPLLRRLSSLSYFHCNQRLELDFKGLVERAQKVEVVSSDLKWHDWERYSGRQKQRMTLGGFAGSVTYRGDFTEFLPLLAWGEVLHVGKGSSFGLGKYEIQAG